MDQDASDRQPGVVDFFLVDGPSDFRVARNKEIEAEVKAYLEAISNLGPYIEHMSIIPKEELAKLEIPNKPAILTWLERLEEWGFMWPGTFLDQQVEFMEDIATTKRVKAKVTRESVDKASIDAKAAAAFATAPAGERVA